MLSIKWKHIKTRNSTAQPFNIFFDLDQTITNIRAQCKHPSFQLLWQCIFCHSLCPCTSPEVRKKEVELHQQKRPKQHQHHDKRRHGSWRLETCSNKTWYYSLCNRPTQMKLPIPFRRQSWIQLPCIGTKCKTNDPQSHHRTMPTRNAEHGRQHLETSKQRDFFGYSCTALTPSLLTIQKLGPGISKASITHIWNAIKNSNPTQNTGTPTPTTILFLIPIL